MRTGKITIDGKEYWLVNSLQAVMEAEELPATMGGVRKTLKMLHILMTAGHAWALHNGRQALQPPTMEALAAEHGPEDISEWAKSIAEVLRGERHVEADPPKKKEAGTSEDRPQK